jgi:hypothetical protein
MLAGVFVCRERRSAFIPVILTTAVFLRLIRALSGNRTVVMKLT